MTFLLIQCDFNLVPGINERTNQAYASKQKSYQNKAPQFIYLFKNAGYHTQREVRIFIQNNN